MPLDQRDKTGSTGLLVEYDRSAACGFPYINCPDELRPSGAFPDSWWVIYAPDLRGGFIVEGYLIEQTLSVEKKLLAGWCTVGLIGYLILLAGLHFVWLLAGFVLWVAAYLLVASLLRRRRLMTNRTWVAFPPELVAALQTTGEIVRKEAASAERRHKIGDGIGKIAGGVSGMLIEAGLGKAAGKASEIAVEAAFKRLAENAMGRGQRGSE
jgi:hypothetical protein